MTDAEYLAWLKDSSAIRCVLVDVVVNDGSETTLYLSNKPYINNLIDNRYDSCLVGNITFKEKLNVNGKPSVSFSTISIDNHANNKDAFIDYVWSGRDITAYYGDVRWPLADFRQIFSGKMDNIVEGKSELKIAVRDKISQLNTTLTDELLGGATDNAERLVPVCFGEVFNVLPLLSDPNVGGSEFQLHNTAIEDVIEVRDNGLPISVTNSLSTGKFTCDSATYGTITASVQGANSTAYDSTIATIIKRIVKEYGSYPFTDSDIDLTNFSTFDSANPQKIGYYTNGRVNILTLISYLASSIGASVICNRDGELQLIQIELPPPGSPTDIGITDIEANSLTLINILDVQPSATIGYCRNDMVQSDIQTGIAEESKSLFAEQWLTTTSNDATASTLHKIDYLPEQKNTALISKTDAEAEALRLVTLWKEKRKIYRFTGLGHLLDLSLGDGVTITHDDFGLSGGETGMIIGLTPNWTKNNVVCEVLI